VEQYHGADGRHRRRARKLKDELDGVIQVPGSLSVARPLLEAGLVDQLNLMTFPVVLGTGRKLFGEMPEKRDWKLRDLRTVGPDGVSVQIYEAA
jgi:dihydrofolate reductase